MRIILMALMMLLSSLTAGAQPRYDFSKLKCEKLDRGVVAVPQSDGTVSVTWRTLRSDRKGEPFDIFINGVKLNSEPLTTGGTYFVDRSPVQGDATYKVVGGGNDGEFTCKAEAPKGYVSVSIDKPSDGYTPDGRKYTYSANDASVADVDGDGAVTLADLAKLQQYLSKKINSL